MNGKNALKLVTEKIYKGSEFQSFIEVEKQILEKTKQKVNNYRSQQEPVDKSKTQVLRLFRGTSCGFKFECLDPPVWICQGEHCNVKVTLDKNLTLDDSYHYTK